MNKFYDLLLIFDHRKINNDFEQPNVGILQFANQVQFFLTTSALFRGFFDADNFFHIWYL